MRQKKGKWSLILSIAAWIVLLLSYMLIANMPENLANNKIIAIVFGFGGLGAFPVLIGLVSVILGIWAVVKEQKKKAAIAGIVISLPAILFCGFCFSMLLKISKPFF